MSYSDIVNEPVKHGQLKVTRFTATPGNVLGVTLQNKQGQALNLRIGFDAAGNPEVTVANATFNVKHRIVAESIGLTIKQNVLL
jgi:hypothetical protein